METKDASLALAVVPAAAAAAAGPVVPAVVVPVGEGPPHGCIKHPVVHAEDQNKAHRESMEDATLIMEELGGPDQAMIAVFDGHAGRETAAFLETHFGAIALEHLRDTAAPQDAMKTIYAEADKACCANEATGNSGATAVSVLVKQRPDGTRTLYCANCGDARATLGKLDGTAVRLSTDHKAWDASEQARIAEAGGFVFRGRVMGILAITRSLGDRQYKEWVVSDPYVSVTEVTPADAFVIVACDGIWDLLTDADAVAVVRRRAWSPEGTFLPEGAALAAKALMEAALEKGTRDNVSVAVVFL